MSLDGGGLGPDADVAIDIANYWSENTLNIDGNHFNSLYAYDNLPKEQCWIYGTTGILTFLMEISDRCWWSGAAVDTVATRVARGSVYLLDRVLDGPGITGTVTDAITGQSLAGTEVIVNEMHTSNVGPRLVDPAFGQYFRLTEPGTYTLTVSRRDYVTQTQSVTVHPHSWSTVDIALMPELSAVASNDLITPDQVNWLHTHNPIRHEGNLRLVLPPDLSAANVDLLTIDGKRITQLGSRLSAGHSHNLALPQGLPAGVYLVRVQAGKQQQVTRITLLH